MNKIKNLYWMCTVLFFLVACDGQGENKNIIFPDSMSKEQIIAASEIESKVTFVALADWQASVLNGVSTRGGATTKWITIDPDHGAAGTHTINITLLPNYTESERSATIKLVCGGEAVSISVTQKKEDEELIEFTPTAKWFIDKIEYIEYCDDFVSETSVINFSYDRKGRVIYKRAI
ncbi:BACON domain-containing protein [Bacteroides reticulotermitis]|uniref:BACON domain-containing protein n=1 Tax=Bacteroides reticulotermitis TaxID=1133319 RepID=UPI003A894875